ncbi:MAG: sodium:solute symporter family transporter [Clostridia bacterium]
MSGWLLRRIAQRHLCHVGTGQMADCRWPGSLVRPSTGSYRSQIAKVPSWRERLDAPEYFQNRFHDTKGILKIASSLFIMIFFLVYTASAFSAGAQLFQTIFGIEYTYALIIGAVVILSYTFLGGFMAVCWTDFIQGLLMLFAILIVPAVALNLMGGLGQLNSAGTAPHFLNPLYNGGERITAVSLISQFAWALGYLGMPHILVRFMAIKNNREVKKSRVIAITWVILSLGAACAIGVIGRAFLPNLGADDKEKVFISMILEIFKGILFCF